ncbi:TetR/AcrR family transcriptional regulator [Actinoplanes aureus]|uniref:TetR/AcrR family transcriptional regulator n=1 Tax=Actinoplanes aureus TaxID=2792083 RepID=A0A931FZL9_9ACTN|nr:TetR-like C-terminal domain-containing protein [Actinoplanes aureus]MBG0565813.1 TetR/AcrR family transcriptional regulator [Actinoplanes aureus]
MPTPERTSLDEIVQAGRDILESAGVAGLTMQAVADRVGVRAPSLYKRVRGRDDLVRLVVEATVRDLGERLAALSPDPSRGTDVPHPAPAAGLHAGAPGADPRQEFAELARAFRAFAHARPVGCQLIFAAKAATPSTDVLAEAVAPVLRVTAALAGERHALGGARTVTAWAYGFVSMELAGAFRLGGDVDEAYELGIAWLADALGKAAS